MVMCQCLEANATQNETLVERMFDLIPDDSMLVVFTNHQGQIRASDPRALETLNIEPQLWQMMMERLDDGDEHFFVQLCKLAGIQIQR